MLDLDVSRGEQEEAWIGTIFVVCKANFWGERWSDATDGGAGAMGRGCRGESQDWTRRVEGEDNTCL